MEEKKSLGVFGLGAFGQLMVQHMAAHFNMRAYDPAQAAHSFAENNPVEMLALEDVAASDIVVLAVPVPKLEGVLEQIKDHVKEGALIMDVGSVKVKPAEQMQRILPQSVNLMGLHPLFGPVGASQGTQGLKLVMCPLRGDLITEKVGKVAAYLAGSFGLDVIMSTPDEHDKEMAYIQGLPHMIAKILIDMEPLPRRMVTPNYKHFLRSIDVVRLDTDDLFQAIFKENPYAQQVRDTFLEKAEALRAKIDE